MDALQFIEKATKSKRQPIYVLYGEEAFLKRRCREIIVKNVLGDADPEFAISTFTGDKLDISTVRNDLETLPFFATVRIVVVEQADPFVSEHREGLERYAEKPSSVGVLILDVKTFPATTRLAKALPDPAKLECKTPAEHRVPQWCTQWCKLGHGKDLNPDACTMLLELVGSSMGLLDQELEKLATAIGSRPTIMPDDVDKLVGRSRAADVFQIMNAIGDKQPAQALEILKQLFDEGEDALAILGPLTYQLRKLAAVGRHVREKLSFGQAMDAAGVPNWPKARIAAERQLKHLGMARVERLTDWLLELNLGLKGDSQLSPRLQLERLIVKLAR